MGPSMVIKHPSKRPIKSEIIIMVPHSKPVNFGAAANNIVQAPMETNEICCNRIRFTFGRSATLPKISLPIPEVAAIQVTKIPPFGFSLSGTTALNTSFTCCTCKYEINSTIVNQL